MSLSANSSKNAALATLIVALWVGLVFLTTPVTEQFDGFDADGRSYGGMAGDARYAGEYAQLSPWRYRVLTPWLAAQLPWEDVLDDFRALAFVSNVASLLVLILILRQLGFSRGMTALGVLLYGGVFWTLKFSFHAPAYIDYQTQLLLLLIIHLTLRGCYGSLLPVFFLAGLQKESLCVFSLFSVAHLLRRGARRSPAARALLCVALPGVAFASPLIPRHVIGPSDTTPTLEVVLGELTDTLTLRFAPAMAQAVFSGLGLLPVILLVHYKPWVGFLRRNGEWELYALISAMLLFGGHDKSRLFLYLLPLAVILALHTMCALREFQARKKFFVWATVVLGVHLYLGRYLAPIGPLTEYVARMVPENAGQGYWRYLYENLAIATGVLVFTIQFMIGEWRFRPAVGFTKSELS